MSSDLPSWTGFVIQNRRSENHVSLAVDLNGLPFFWGERFRVEAGGVAAEAFFHGTMKTWSVYRRLFGGAAAEALAVDPGIDAYEEGTRTMGGSLVPGHEAWLRLSARIGGPWEKHPLFQLSEGASVTVNRVGEAAPPAKPRRSVCKNGEIAAWVLASHPHGLTLNVDAPLLRKLGAAADAWHELEAGGRLLPVTARRGLSPDREAEIWSRPQALLFDFEPHWIFDKVTVMTLAPMQMNWRGRFPEAAGITTAVAPAGTIVTLRPGS